MSTTIQVNEVFDSIQGEGYWAGIPATFLRLQGCNLRCPWCDTKHAQGLEGGQEWDTDDLAQELLGHKPTVIVITGGEPLMQAEAIKELWVPLVMSKRLHFETNGHYPMPPISYKWLTVSPKPPNYPIHSGLNPDEIKIIITDSYDLGVTTHLFKLYPTAEMCLQPVDNDPEMIATIIKFLHSDSFAYRWRLSLQTHKFVNIK